MQGLRDVLACAHSARMTPSIEQLYKQLGEEAAVTEGTASAGAILHAALSEWKLNTKH